MPFCTEYGAARALAPQISWHIGISCSANPAHPHRDSPNQRSRFSHTGGLPQHPLFHARFHAIAMPLIPQLVQYQAEHGGTVSLALKASVDHELLQTIAERLICKPLAALRRRTRSDRSSARLTQPTDENEGGDAGDKPEEAHEREGASLIDPGENRIGHRANRYRAGIDACGHRDGSGAPGDV